MNYKAHARFAELAARAYNPTSGDIVMRHENAAVIIRRRYKSTIILPVGTDDFFDVIHDLDTRLKFFPGYGSVSTGFYDHWCILLDQVGQVIPTNRPINIYAHSLGGAGALLAPLIWRDNPALLKALLRGRIVTFGCPRVGGQAFADWHKMMGFNITMWANQDDPVPRHPILDAGALWKMVKARRLIWPGTYQHIKDPLWITEAGVSNQTPRRRWSRLTTRKKAHGIEAYIRKIQELDQG